VRVDVVSTTGRFFGGEFLPIAEFPEAFASDSDCWRVDDELGWSRLLDAVDDFGFFSRLSSSNCSFLVAPSRIFIGTVPTLETIDSGFGGVFNTGLCQLSRVNGDTFFAVLSAFWLVLVMVHVLFPVAVWNVIRGLMLATKFWASFMRR
jgi:hypothetical protein